MKVIDNFCVSLARKLFGFRDWCSDRWPIGPEGLFAWAVVVPVFIVSAFTRIPVVWWLRTRGLYQILRELDEGPEYVTPAVQRFLPRQISVIRGKNRSVNWQKEGF